MAAEKDPSATRAVVWIVDDLRSEVASLTRLLSADFTLEIFETGPQMLERLESAPPPDVLVIEQWLRGPTGVEICRSLRASPATVGLPILLLTVPVDDDEILHGLAAGADDYLIKPFSPPLLAARIVSLIRVKRLRERAERAEAEARSERAWLARTLESVGDALIATDEAGRVVFMNPVALQLTGWTIDDARGRPLEEVLDIVNETTRLPVENPVAKVLRDGKIVGLANHTVLRSKDGSEVAIDDSAAPIRDEQGRISGVVLVFRDVAEARRKDTELRAAHALAERLLVETQVAHRAADLERERLAAVIAHAPMAIAILRGEDNIVVLANDAIGRLWGFTPVVLLGQPIFDILVTAKGQGFQEILAEVRRTGVPFVGRERPVHLPRQGGGVAIHIHNFTYQPLRASDGSITDILAVAIDVTAEVQARRAVEAVAANLHANEERLRRVVEASSVGLWDLDAATGQIEADARMIELMGFPWHRVQPRLGPRQPPGGGRRARPRCRHRRPRRRERRPLLRGVSHRRKERRSLRWVESRAQALFDAEGKATHLAGAMIDVTARKQVEAAQQSLLEEIQRSEQSLRTLAEAIPQQVWTSRPDGALDFVNERVLAYFAATEEHILGAGWQAVIHPEDLPATTERWTHAHDRERIRDRVPPQAR